MVPLGKTVPLWPHLKNDLLHHGWDLWDPRALLKAPGHVSSCCPARERVKDSGEMRRGAKTKNTQFHDGFW